MIESPTANCGMCTQQQKTYAISVVASSHFIFFLVCFRFPPPSFFSLLPLPLPPSLLFPSSPLLTFFLPLSPPPFLQLKWPCVFTVWIGGQWQALPSPAVWMICMAWCCFCSCSRSLIVRAFFCYYKCYYCAVTILFCSTSEKINDSFVAITAIAILSQTFATFILFNINNNKTGKYWWRQGFQHPYEAGDSRPLVQLLSNIMWRNSKHHVIDEVSRNTTHHATCTVTCNYWEYVACKAVLIFFLFNKQSK